MGAYYDFDRNLFRRIQDDDRLSLNSLFAEYYQKLCGFAFTFLRNEQEAEECVADIFATIWKRRKTLFIESSVKAHLYTSVRNAVIAIIRQRNPLLVNLDTLANIPSEETNAGEQEIILTELNHEIEKAVDSLPPRCRQIFIMSRMESFSYKAIGEMLGISEKTVENHLVKALTILQTALASYRVSSHLK